MPIEPVPSELPSSGDADRGAHPQVVTPDLAASAVPLTVAVTGVTGYVGGRLVPELIAAGHRVRAIARNPGRLRGRPWFGDVDVVQADASELDTIRGALEGVDVAYYLIHSLGSGSQFEARDRATALTFGRAAREAGVGRIIYLGGLFPEGEVLSPHLESRREVGEILLASGVPTTVLRAAIILGSGSASFEMMRYLTERLPAMTVPKWVDNRIQPIAIRDVLRYLVGSAAMPPEVSRGFDIGGPDVLTYRQMMQGYAAAAGLPRRLIVKVPVLTPRLSSLWVGLVTPVPSGLARPLVESLIHEVVCDEHDIEAYVPDPPDGLVTFERALRLALERIQDADVTTRWTSASFAGAPSDPLPSDPDWAGGSLFVDERRTVVHATPEALWEVLESVGGERGWYSWALAWRVRGVLDKLSGGPGLRRGRRDPRELQVDDAVDFWRVEEVDRGTLLRLRAEMRLPGLAWLELRVEDDGAGATVFAQRALFHPHGLAGQLYWRSIVPFHGAVFGGMQRGIALAAEQLASGPRPAGSGRPGAGGAAAPSAPGTGSTTPAPLG
ncbi:SDR family oxidoreductase [Pengzhenrongella sicca]|uniref:SDR family oxidoreductase n=1 Tax=Pengzhenrongella sicca TaxID=2819238 RepID=A0A8A4ZGC0_9MICO|nr:SDR family oxidoreductase [Pengzhenrongella sicca]QTE30441.1 SDR family oxidoreductase [Pengzhenrongella sicca]